jgi:4-amino-4-deoxy-L-arabinose transferase-like glycosyltransferase
VEAGLGWAQQFPYVAQYFATARAVIGLSMAPVIAVLGEREVTVCLSTCAYYAATLMLTLGVLSRLIGAVPATVACAVMATFPLLALKSNTPSADMPELFFVAASFWLFWVATQREGRLGLLVAAGVCAALAFSAHEIAVGLLAYYGVLFLAGYGIPRREYWIMAAGFLGIIALEGAYYAVLAGDPLHRFSMLLGAVSKGGDRVEVGFLEFAAGGTLHVSGYVDPLLMFFLKHEFGLVGFAAVPALWWAFVARRADRSLPVLTARLLAGLGLVWFLFVAVQLRELIVLPRYYMVTAYCLLVAIAIWAVLEVWPRRPVLGLAGTALFVLASLAGIYADNKNPRFGERALVEYLGVSSGPVYTDPLTAHNSEWYCRWAKVDYARIKAGPPALDQAYFYNPRHADRPNRFVRAEQVHLYQPDSRWREVWRKDDAPRLAGHAIQELGLAKFLPQRIVAKLDRPNPSVQVFQASH